MKRFLRIAAAVLCIAMTFAAVPFTHAQASSGTVSRTYAQIKNLVNEYYDTVTAKGTKTAFWNAGIGRGTAWKTSAKAKGYSTVSGTEALRDAADKKDWLYGITYSSCAASCKAYHLHDSYGLSNTKTEKGCSSNFYSGPGSGGASQCYGFALYMQYVLFHTTDLTTYTTYSPSKKLTSGDVRPGDLLRVNGHSYVVYAVSADGSKAYTIECNGSAKGNFCKIYQNTRNVSDIVRAVNGASGNSLRRSSCAREACETAADYTALCTKTCSTSLTLKVTGSKAAVRNCPATSSAFSGSKTVVTAARGQVLTATAIYKNTKGQYWYKVKTAAGKMGYLYPSGVSVAVYGAASKAVFDGTAVSGTLPQKAYSLPGTVKASGCMLRQVTGTLTDSKGARQTGTVTGSRSSLTLKGSMIDSSLKFAKLAAGTAKYSLKAVYRIFYIKSDQTLGYTEKTSARTYSFRIKKP